jgi:hypothetical protein
VQSWPSKDPNEVLDYQFDWADEDDPRLEDGETLTDSDFSVVTGTVVIDSQDWVPTGLTTVWLSGGTLNEACVILNRVVTSEGRTYDKSARLRIRNH